MLHTEEIAILQSSNPVQLLYMALIELWLYIVETAGNWPWPAV